ncbi:MAG: PASTA domain-containing protein [Brotaphodocola sp.]
MNRLCMGCMREYDDRFAVCPHCGYVFNTPAGQSYHMAPGTVLNNRYIAGKVLGFGGFGVTYIGWDYVMSRRVAIKEYLPSEFATRMPTQTQVTVYSGDREEQFREGMKKMLDEAKRLAKVENISGIVQIYDCFEENGTSYIVMEYLEGITLKAYLETHGPMEVEQALPIVVQIADAMDSVHLKGILHRDIAPDNIYVLNPENPDALQVKLLDFGAARYAASKQSKSLSVIIKPGYAPVEQYRSRGDQGPWTDVYALAATFYKMLTGITPEDAMERSTKDELKKPSKLGCRIPKSVETALMNALNIRIEDRTASMMEFMDELMGDEVEANHVTKEKTDFGKVPKPVLAAVGAGIAAAVITAILIGTGIWKPDLKTEDSQLEANVVRVPNVVNKEAAEAEWTLKFAGLEMVRDRAIYSNEIPEDRICYQAVKDNATLAKHAPLLVWVSKGAEKGMFPPVKGLTQEEAQILLDAAGFSNYRIEESQEPGMYGTVLSANQEPGESVALAEEVVLVVCVNEDSLSQVGTRVLEVPDVVALTSEEAQERLTEQGLQVIVAETFSKEPEGTVVRQIPIAGFEANESSYVTIYVSKGPEKIYMEYVRDMTEYQARTRITELGLEVGSVELAYSDTVPKGNVISQSVAPNTEVHKNDIVNLVVSRGKDPEQVREERDEAAIAQEQEKQQALAEEEAKRKAEEEAAAEAVRRQAEQELLEAQQREAEEAAVRQAKEAAEAEAKQQEESDAQETMQYAGVGQVQNSADGSQIVLASGKKTTAKQVTVPDVCGMSRSSAKAAIEAADLKVGKISEEYSDSVSEGYVISQSEEPGDEVSKGTKIKLVISLGAE